MSDSVRLYGLWPAWLLCPWGFSRQEYWSGLPCPLPNKGIKPTSLVSPALAGRFFTTSVILDSVVTNVPSESKVLLIMEARAGEEVHGNSFLSFFSKCEKAALK